MEALTAVVPSIWLLAIATFCSTLFGGFLALKFFKDKLHLVLGFSAGAVLGVVFFDLIPEAFELGGMYFSTSTMSGVIALGFLAYLILDRLLSIGRHDDADCENRHHHKGVLGAGSLSVHSFLDGVAIGLAFQVSPAIGAVVAIAVLVHDFSDGLNTVNMILRSGGSPKTARRWLITDALAPVLGVAAAQFFSVPEASFGIILALFAGFFLYIGASDLLPESHHAHPTVWTMFATIAGMAVLFGAIQLAGV